jgi:hypothetical protein
MTMLNCTKCDGKGEAFSDFANYNQVTREFSPGMKACIYCQGRGTFPELNVEAVVSACFTTRGGKRFRKSMTSPVGRASPEAVRAYYVWRLARFHGGADVTMPITAMMLIDGDPMVKMLDAISDRVALAAFGTSNAAATRWGRALGYDVPETPGLPASAYSGGPVHDGHDPNTTAMLAVESKG